MGYKFNPLIFSGLDLTGGDSGSLWKTPVQAETDLPTTDADGTARIVLDTDKVYVYDAIATKWIDAEILMESFGVVATTEGALIETVEEVVGVNTIVRKKLSITPADSTHPGSVSINAQSFSGDKTFNNDIIVVNDLTVGNDSHISGSQQVDTDSTVDGNSLIKGNSTVNGNEHILTDLEVDGDTILQGDLTVNGTTTSINTTDLEVEDKNITINKGGNDASAEGAGLTVERLGTDGSLIYDKDITSKWKLGDVGLEVEVADISSTQVITNKSIDVDNNTITNIENDNIKVGAAIDAEKLADGSVSNTELQYINSLTSNAQDQLDSKIPLAEKAVANGVATLDVNGLVPENQLPDLVKINTHNVADETAMLALVAQTGDHAVRADLNTTFILQGTDPTILTEWQEIISRVNSVNGHNQDVVLTTSDIGEGTNLYYTDARAKAATVIDSPVGTETDVAPSVRYIKEYVNSQESGTILESQTNTVLIDLISSYSVNSGANIIITVKIDADVDLYEIFNMNIVKHSTGYHFSEVKVGDNTNVEFSISNAGELTYTSQTYTGFISGECIVKVIPLL